MFALATTVILLWPRGKECEKSEEAGPALGILTRLIAPRIIFIGKLVVSDTRAGRFGENLIPL